MSGEHDTHETNVTDEGSSSEPRGRAPTGSTSSDTSHGVKSNEEQEDNLAGSYRNVDSLTRRVQQPNFR